MPIWERQDGETNKSWRAFQDFMEMGVGRSLVLLHEKYTETNQSQPPTKSIATLKEWSMKFDWFARCLEYDKDQYEQHQERKRLQQMIVETNSWNSYLVMQKVIEKRLELTTDGNYKLSAADAHSILGLMQKADDYARRITGLPDRISESKTDVTSDGKAIAIAVVKMDIDAL